MYWYEQLGVHDDSENYSFKANDTEYVVKNQIIRQKELYSSEQEQTKDAFSFKWHQKDSYETDVMKANSLRWLTERYVGEEKETFSSYFRSGAKVLDAGCGSGFSALLLFEPYLRDIHYLGVDISTAIEVAKQRFQEHGQRGEFIQANLQNLPFTVPVFDVIFSEGVLHHTDSTEASIKRLAKLILPDGVFMFYVYNKKAPIREYSDDLIRDYLKELTDEEAWNAMLPLTKLGKAVGDLHVTLNIPEAIPFLGIPAGAIDMQRFIYWYIFKAYYRPEFGLPEMNHINFDWYRPMNCHRQTPEQVEQWCSEAGLVIQRLVVEEAGITVIAKKL